MKIAKVPSINKCNLIRNFTYSVGTCYYIIICHNIDMFYTHNDT